MPRTTSDNGSDRVPLLERDGELDTLASDLDAVRRSRRGRVVTIAGEAGIGKSALIREFCGRLPGDRVLYGWCDALLTPRPLGPFIDIAQRTGGQFEQLVQGEASPSELIAALSKLLRRRPGMVVVIEDAHWADDATLDALRLLGRRCGDMEALLLVTYRDDELDRAHPLRIVLGELPRDSARRLKLAPLSVTAVAQLASRSSADAKAVHARTGGNPFFVTEALEVSGTEVPETVRDAVLARAARLSAEEREVLDAVAIVPQPTELWLLEAVVGRRFAELERCVSSGMLRAAGDAVVFRHEIARVAIEESILADRARALHRRVLAALVAPPGGRRDLARVAHHAEASGDHDAVLLYAPQAGEQAAAMGAHRAAAEQFRRALKFADGLPREQRVELIERRAHECYLIDEMQQAIDGRQEALLVHRARGDRLREGDTLRWLSRLSWFVGDRAGAEAYASDAIALLESLPPGRELAMAYSNMAQLRMLERDLEGTRRWGEPAIALAEELQETEILVHALNNVGTAEFYYGAPEGLPKLQRSLELARTAGLEEGVARGLVNVATTAGELRRYDLAEPYLAEGIAYCNDNDLDSWGRYMTAWLARVHLERGRWEDATALASEVLEREGMSAPTRITAQSVIGRLRARRGDPDPWVPLDDVSELASRAEEVQRILPVALARAEGSWLAGKPEVIGTETDAPLELAIRNSHAWGVGELLLWRRRAGIDDPMPDMALPEAVVLELAGVPAAAYQAWTEAGCPYEAALALLESRDESELRRALNELRQLGAQRTAAHVARRLRERGIRDLEQGPRATTRANAAGLTRRELDVLKLVAAGMRNAQIAQALVVSPRTVDHHVSAILAKLGVASRTEAAVRASQLGLIESLPR